MVATLTIDFLHELTAGQLRPRDRCHHAVGRKSFDYEMRLYEADAMRHCATQRTVEVCFDTTRRVGATAGRGAEALERQVSRVADAGDRA